MMKRADACIAIVRVAKMYKLGSWNGLGSSRMLDEIVVRKALPALRHERHTRRSQADGKGARLRAVRWCGKRRAVCVLCVALWSLPPSPGGGGSCAHDATEGAPDEATRLAPHSKG